MKVSEAIPALRHGDAGALVADVQAEIGATPDGKFGPATAAAVKAWQTRERLSPDGVIGPRSWSALRCRPIIGIDVSHHNGAIDFAALDPAVRFAYVKATEGRDFNSKATESLSRRASVAGLAVGLYHFARPDRNGPEAEAENFARTIEACAREGIAIRLPPVLDLEVSGDLDPETIRDWVEKFSADFTRRIECPIRSRVMLYTYASFWRAHVDPSETERERLPRDVWIARYKASAVDPGTVPDWQIWQRSGSGNVAGVVGRVDLNVARATWWNQCDRF